MLSWPVFEVRLCLSVEKETGVVEMAWWFGWLGEKARDRADLSCGEKWSRVVIQQEMQNK